MQVAIHFTSCEAYYQTVVHTYVHGLVRSSLNIDLMFWIAQLSARPGLGPRLAIYVVIITRVTYTYV